MKTNVSVRSMAQGGAGFGTSGVRGTVNALTDRVCFAYTTAFLDVVAKAKGAPRAIAIAHDLRPSSPRMVAACVAACRLRGLRVIHGGALPTPALAHFAIQHGHPAVMVTGSHIPFDRNGIKFYRPDGEISKGDEAAIADAVVPLDESAFDRRGMLVAPEPPPVVASEPGELYRRRYLEFFRPGFLRGKRIAVYEHSSVARDLCTSVLRELGAEVVSLGRTDSFVPVDTEAVSEADARQARAWAAEHRLDALVSTDGDADRPLVGDEAGALFRGDVVGMLCAAYVGAKTVVTPVSSNTAVERWGVFRKVVRTRIGSPYVLAAMSDAARSGEPPVAGYEANGGFMLGSAVEARDRRGTLAALPTRDALLPILSVLALAAERGCAVSKVTDGLPHRFTASDRVQEFPTERSRRVIEHLASMRGALASFFASLGKVTEVNSVDGVRVTLDTGEIVHLRPSGNAPELRCYAEADSPARAAALSRWGLEAAKASSRDLGDV